MSTWSSRFRRRGLVVLAMTGCLALAACGSEEAESPSGGSGSQASGESLEGKKVMHVACAEQNQWCRAYNNAIVDALKAKGVDVTYLQDPYDPVQQVQNLNQAISQKPDLITLLATDARAVVPALKKAEAANIPVINLVGPTVPESDPLYAASIENNHKQLGENAATVLVEGLKKAGHDEGNIIAITGATVQPEVEVRMEGFREVLSKSPEYELVEVQDGSWDQVKTAKIAQQLFAKYRDKGGIVGAYGMADQQAAGIIQAAEQAGLEVGADKGGLIVVASNCFKIGMENISEGKQYGTSTQAPVPTAEFTIPLLEKFLAGEEIPEQSLTEESPITKENIAEFEEYCNAA